MQPIATTSSLFRADQQFTYAITFYDTPFTVLEGGLASSGMRLDVTQPLSSAAWSSYTAAVKSVATNTSALTTFTNAALASQVVTGGRTDNVAQYWAGGAPGKWGAATAGRVGLHWGGTLRPQAGRSWWSNTANPTFYLALAGSGYVRVEATVSGTTSVLFAGDLSEKDYLENGFQLSTAVTASGTTAIDIYYLQADEAWGGLVVKCVAGARTASSNPTLARSSDQAAAIAAPVLGCGIFDAGTVAGVALSATTDVELQHRLGQTASLSFAVPLINSAVTDGTGWQFQRAASGDPGFLRLRAGGATVADVARYRLVQVTAGYVIGGTTETYTVFTGLIDDFELQGDAAKVACRGFESRLLDRFDKMYPDKISYMTWGFRKTSGTAEPIYDVQAFDNWPIEYAVQELCYRAGIDGSRLNKTLTVPTSSGVATAVTIGSTTFRKVWARSVKLAQLKLERPVHYGNVGVAFDEAKPQDDAYLFRPEATYELWNRVREIAERYGYDVRFDEFGDFLLQSRNNASAVTDVAVADGGSNAALQKNPAAYGGTYIQYTGTQTLSFVLTVTGARFDVVLPRFVGAGSWTVNVYDPTLTTLYNSLTIDPSLPSGSDPVFYYDNRLSPDGTNPCVSTVYSGDFATYKLQFVPTGTSTLTRRLDCVLSYHTDPVRPLLPQTLSTATNLYEISVNPGAADVRNFVTVVGRRRATVTDSAKINQSAENGEAEFVVQAAVDINGVLNPTAVNFAGGTRESVIYQDTITDEDFAAYMARSFIYRYRLPRPSASGTHTLLPVLQLRDPIYMADTKHNAISTGYVVYVTAITHRISERAATTDVETVAFPEFPSYDPREDIDIDAQYAGNAVANIQVSYTSLTGHTQTNLSKDVKSVVKLSRDSLYISPTAGGDIVEITTPISVTAGSPAYLDLSGQPWPPIPGTVFLQAAVGTDAAGEARTTTITDFWYDTNQDGFYKFREAAPYGSRLPNLKSIDEVTIRVKLTDHTTINSTSYTLTGGKVSKGRQAGVPFWYEYDENTEVFNWGVNPSARPGSVEQMRCQVTWRKAIKGASRSWITNNPNHHFFNVDYRDPVGGSGNTENLIDFPLDLRPWLTQSTTATYNTVSDPFGTTKGSQFVNTTVNDRVWRIYECAASTQYTLSWYAKNNGGTAVKYAVRDETNNATIVAATSYIGSINGSTWTRITATFTTPSGCTELGIYPIFDSGAGAAAVNVYITGIQLNTGATAQTFFSGGENLLPNSEALDQWTLGSDLSLSVNAAADPYGNTAVAEFVSSSNSTGANNYAYKDVTVTPGASYTYSFFFTNGGGASGAYNYKIVDQTHATDIVALTNFNARVPYGAPWHRIAQTFTAPAGCTTVRIYTLHANSVGYMFGNWFGGQLNVGAQPRPYTATTTSAVTLPAGAGQRINLVWNHGDGTTLYQRGTVTSYKVKYRVFGPVDATTKLHTPGYGSGSPFYDPYTSEVGNLVAVKFDALVSGLYRISIRALGDDTVVAWLTEPTAAPDNVESHWSYFGAGAGKTLYWDGVDTIGAWNQLQSEPYATAAAGAFEQDQRPLIGRGFYAWNQERQAGAQAPLALIADDRDATTGKPVFGQGTFGKFYVHFEVMNDTLKALHETSSANAYPRIVRTDDLDTDFDGKSDSSAVIYTHLPAPAYITMTAADWTGTNFESATQTAIDTTSNWSTSADTDATLNNQKPTRVRFTLQNRPGTLWTGKQGLQSVRLFRLAHHKASIFDQAVAFNGTNYPGTAVEDRTIFNRRLMNDTHTFLFADDAYRQAQSFKQADNTAGFEWIFQPKQCKKDFRGRGEEPIAFNDYLMFEEVPKWDLNKSVAGARARLQIAFMNQLWYLSAYVQDRSGRMVWAVNDRFLDQSKILKNAYGDWPDPSDPSTAATSTTYRADRVDDPNLMHRRTILTRQWTDEGTWQASQRTKWGFASNSLGDKLLKHKWKYHSASQTTIDGTTLWSSFTALKQDYYTTWHAQTTTLDKLPSGYTNLTRQLGDQSSTALNTWTWETSPIWVPCVTRDFHGFHIMPPMVDEHSNGYNEDSYIYASSDYRSWYNTNDANTGGDCAAAQVWSSPVYDMTETYSSSNTGSAHVRFYVGRKVIPGQDPIGMPAANVCDYLRQDESVHWEDLRGLFSRGPRPLEQPLKVAPVLPYYVNQFQYSRPGDAGGILAEPARHNQLFYKYRLGSATTPDTWFDMKFRSEYVWESGSMFPSTLWGAERLEAYNADRTRFLTSQNPQSLRYDGGAWTGWKDDVPVSGLGDTDYTLRSGFSFFALDGQSGGSAFDQGTLPIAVGPRLVNITRDMYFHLVLVNERREAPFAGI